jgi:hypothetical protein
MLWIEAQWTTVIALLVFGVCYMLTAAIFCSAAILSRRAVARDLKAVVQALTPLGSSWGCLSDSSLIVCGRILIAPTNTLVRRPVH